MAKLLLVGACIYGLYVNLTDPAIALQFPQTCVTPPATVTDITGIDTRDARMKARYTMPDIVQACHAGYVGQGSSPAGECIRLHSSLVNAPPLHANADCVSGVVTVEGLRTVPHADCASGGIRAIETFKTLCPKYSKEIERKD